MFLQDLDTVTNVWGAINTLILTLGPILATVVTYLLTKKQSAKVEKAATTAVTVTQQGTAELKSEAKVHTAQLGEISSAVNGRLTKALEEVKTLQARVAYLEGKVSK